VKRKEGPVAFNVRGPPLRSTEVPLPFLATCRVPGSLDGITSIGTEADPTALDVSPADVGRVWQAVERLYRSGIHPAMQLCVRRHGQVILDRALGHASGNGPTDAPDTPKVPATPATPFTIFSAGKAVTAMLVHLLDQRDQIRLDDPVAEYVPEFGTGTKRWITIRHLLTHRAGIPNLPRESMDLDRLVDPGWILRTLCATRLAWRPGWRLAYHPFTAGFVLGEVVRRVTGASIAALLDQAIRRPLGLRWLGYGVAPADLGQVAVNYFTGPIPLPPVSTLVERALGLGIREVTALSNDPRFLTGVVPSANVVTTASELARFYQLLLDGGELDGVRVFDPRTVRRATCEQSYLEVDLTFGLPVRYAMGFMLGGDWLSVYGPDTRHAFGHLGFTNILAWADPERDLAAALLTSGKPLLYPQLWQFFAVARQIGLACGKVARRRQQVAMAERADRRRAARV
jgi:CubicO group peptidase (beta-lactamase class C family)